MTLCILRLAVLFLMASKEKTVKASGEKRVHNKVPDIKVAASCYISMRAARSDLEGCPGYPDRLADCEFTAQQVYTDARETTLSALYLSSRRARISRPTHEKLHTRETEREFVRSTGVHL